MTATGIEARINQIFLDAFELEPAQLKPEAHIFTDLGLDSLDTIDLVIAFQREFKIRPENAELREIRTLGDVYALVGKYATRAQTGGASESPKAETAREG